jgi:predicted helicase
VRPGDLDFPVTTDEQVVRRFLAQPQPVVVFSTYQSAKVVAKGMPKGCAFDLGIFDEAHKTAGREGAQFGFALKDRHLKIRRRLFMTATPRHYDIRRRNAQGDPVQVYSMDQPKVYGPVVHTLSFAAAVKRKLVVPLKVLISVVTQEHLEARFRGGEVVVDGVVVKARQVANAVAVQKGVEKYGISKIFSFHRSVDSAESAVAWRIRR